jgi:hypothetical protein
MISDAFVRVNCDSMDCDSEEEIQLTATACNSYDGRNVATDLHTLGWEVISDGEQYCPNCMERNQTK